MDYTRNYSKNEISYEEAHQNVNNNAIGVASPINPLSTGNIYANEPS